MSGNVVHSRTAPLQDPVTGRFLPGNSGNGGRRRGARNRLGESFISDILDAWERRGKEAIDAVIRDRPADFLKVVVSLLPKHMEMEQDPLRSVSDKDLEALILLMETLVEHQRVDEGLDGQARQPIE